MDLHLKESCECKYDAVSLDWIRVKEEFALRVHFEFGKAAENIM